MTHARIARLVEWATLSRFDVRAALLPMAGMAALLMGGVATNRELSFSIAAGAAFSVGFGAKRRLFGRHWAAMLIAFIGMTIAAFVGTLAGRDPVLELGLTAGAGAICGALASRNGDLWWVCVQLAIAFLVAAHYPGGTHEALQRALLVAGGGMLQFVFIGISMRVVGPPIEIPPATTVSPAGHETTLHALRAALCMAAALAAGNLIGLANSYWAPMTALLVLKPGLRDTGLRGLERVGGTLAGIVLATIVASALIGARPALALVTILAASAAFGLQQARYALLSGMITTSVVLMTVLAGSPVLAVDRHRIAATLLGGAIALAGAWIAPRQLPWRRFRVDRG